jgi:membrane protein YqaA with SNARE-associated domain
MTDLGAYGGLFAISFLAATFFPAQSEIMLTALLLGGDFSVAALVVVASIGNTLGSVVNWAIGLQVERFKHRRWFPATPDQLDRASAWYRKYGCWSLLLSWAPFIGDPLTLAAGILREPFGTFLILVAIAKTARYIIVAALTLGVLQL